MWDKTNVGQDKMEDKDKCGTRQTCHKINVGQDKCGTRQMHRTIQM